MILLGDTSSTGCLSIAVFLFSGVLFEEVLDLNLPQEVDFQLRLILDSKQSIFSRACRLNFKGREPSQ